MDQPTVLARCVQAAGAFAICAAALCANAAKQWTVVDLTPDAVLGGGARGVNNRGDVIGQTITRGSNGFPQSHAFLWQNGVRPDIGSALGASTTPWTLNDKGSIAITVDGYAYLWNDGQASALGFAGDVYGMNKFGAMIGHYWTGGVYGYGADRAVLYRDGVVTELGTLGGVWSGASAINDKGVVVGNSYLPRSSTFRAFIWQDGVMRELPGLGGTESFASRINNHGEIVGAAFDPAGRLQMVRWTAANLPPEVLMVRGSPQAINDHGDIAGNNLDNGKPFLLERDGTLTWLLDIPAMRDAGWHTFAVFAMNDRGWIVGLAWKPDGPQFGSAVLLMPK